MWKRTTKPHAEQCFVPVAPPVPLFLFGGGIRLVLEVAASRLALALALISRRCLIVSVYAGEAPSVLHDKNLTVALHGEPV